MVKIPEISVRGLFYLLRSTLAASVPVSIVVNVGDCSALIHGIERQEMDFRDSRSCLPINKKIRKNSKQNKD